jgi:hypothetical protein
VVWCLVRVTRLVVCGAVAWLVFRCGRIARQGRFGDGITLVALLY